MLGRALRIPPEGIELLEHPHLLTGEYYGQLFLRSWNVVEPFAIGGMLLSVVCSLTAYPVTLWALRKHRNRRDPAS